MPQRVVLKGEAVWLEPLELAHVGELLAAASEDRSTYAYTFVPNNDATMRAYVESAIEDERSGSALPFAIRRAASGEVVGTSRFLDLEYWPEPLTSTDPSVVEIGSTWLATSAQRSAVNTEAKLLMLGHAFESWQVKRVTFKTDARNARSRAAIERVGARFEGVRRAHMLAADGSVRDSAYFSIVQEEWPAVKDALTRRLRPR